MPKLLRPILLSGVLLVGAYLRITGLSWGINSGYGHDLNFQPDEFISLRGVLQLDLLRGGIKAPGAYFEGTFNYYLWAVPQAVLKLTSTDAMPLGVSTSMTKYSSLLYICRWMSVLFDLCAIFVVFLAIKEATQKFYPALVGALCYAVVPIQVIYAHFMRTHTLSNLLCALVIWMSLKLRQSQRWQMLFTVGAISGLGAATRYPVGIIVLIPCFYLIFNGSDHSPGWKAGLLQRAKRFAGGQVWVIALGFGLGLFFGHPMLFLDPSGVGKAITGETLKYASLQQFSGRQLVNLAAVWRYIAYVIPFGMYPLLWLIPYGAILYLLFRRRLYSLSLPIMIFSGLYLYFMGKGYLVPYFARITMLLFPGFCILAGMAFSDLQLRLRSYRLPAVALAGVLLLLFVPSVMFDIAYGRALQQKDVRELVRQDLRKQISQPSATIGIARLPLWFYTAMPAAKPLASDKVTVQLQGPEQKADFFLIGFPAQVEPALLNATIQRIEAQGKFKFERSYALPVKIFGYRFKLARFPQDMTYPFPAILLFRATAPTSA